MQEEQTRLLGSQPNSIWEILAKAVAVLTAAALATAFLYDSVYFQVLDERLLGVFALSDHIETAVLVLKWIVTASVVALALFFFIAFVIKRIRFISNLRAQMRMAAIFLVIFILFYTAFLFGLGELFPEKMQRFIDLKFEILTVLFVGILVASWMTWVLFRITGPENIVKASLMALPILWVAYTVTFARLDAKWTLIRLNAHTGTDAVTLVDQGQLFGSVIKIVDKGVILGSSDPVLFKFVPKEKVSRVDLSNR
jgi:hypothetical protein